MTNHIGSIKPIVPPVTINKETIANYLAECVQVIYGKDPKNPLKLLDRLMTEGVGGKPSRPLEFIPCKIKPEQGVPHPLITSVIQNSAFHELMCTRGQLFGFCTEDSAGQYYYYTNARELLNWGWTLDEVLEVVDFTYYQIFKCTAPYFIYGQISTHTQLTTVSHSQRYAESNLGYWMPEEVAAHTFQNDWDDQVQTSTPIDTKEYLKRNGVNRKEVFDRGIDMLQYRSFTIGGYRYPNAWEHFLNQRVGDHHAQKEVREFCEMFTKFIDY